MSTSNSPYKMNYVLQDFHILVPKISNFLINLEKYNQLCLARLTKATFSDNCETDTSYFLIQSWL